MKSMQEYRRIIGEALPDMLPDVAGYGNEAVRAARYSLLAGGKHIRACLTLAACDMISGDYRDALYAACAVECIHTYSLIHDDLPALDNDDLRRGLPSCHAKFGEAMAILAGDGLNTHAFWLISEGARLSGTHADRHMRALSHLAAGAGFSGMVSGQSADIALPKEQWSGDALDYIHANKTAALFRAAMLAGAEIGGAERETLWLVSEYSFHLGLAFQAADDLLDATSTPEELGKTPGKDTQSGKLTAVALYGMEKARQCVNHESETAARVAKELPGAPAFFHELALSLAKRTR